MKVAVDLAGLQTAATQEPLREAAIALVERLTDPSNAPADVTFRLFARGDRPSLPLTEAAQARVTTIDSGDLPTAATDVLFRVALLGADADYALRFACQGPSTDPFPLPTALLGDFAAVSRTASGLQIPLTQVTGEADPGASLVGLLRALPTPARDVAFRRVVASESSESASGRRRVAFLSPLLPLRSGISDYSAEIVSALTRHYDMDLYTSDGCVTPSEPAPFPARGYTTLERALREPKTANPYDLLLYQVGNNVNYHAEMYALLLRHAGIVVVHDFVLTGLVLGMHYNRPDLGVYLPDEFAYECGPTRGADLFQRFDSGKIVTEDLDAENVPLTRRLFTRSLGVIVHNQWAFDTAVRLHGDENPLIRLIPMVMTPVPLDDTPASIAELRRKHGVPVDAFVIAPCGYVTQSKRPTEILDAFQTLLAERPDAYLIFVGAVNPGDLPPGVDFDAEIARRGLTARVRVTGYTEFAAFNEYLRLSDVCVTLRYPSQGESSGALLRMLVHAKPSIVTAIGSFANFPDDVVYKLPAPEGMRRDDEVKLILDAFRHLARDGKFRQELGDRGAAFVHREHSPEHCARLYAEFGEEVLRHSATRAKRLSDYAARELARRVASDPALAATPPETLFAPFARTIAAAA